MMLLFRPFLQDESLVYAIGATVVAGSCLRLVADCMSMLATVGRHE